MRFSLALVVYALSVWGCRTPPSKAIVLDVAGRTVTLEELEKFVGVSVQEETQAVSDDLKVALFEQLIEEQLLLKAADDAGIVADREAVAHLLDEMKQPEPQPAGAAQLDDVALRRNVERQARIEQLVEKNVLSALGVSDDEVAAYFEEHTADFARAETVDVSQILVESEELATELRASLVRDPGSFEELAKEHSIGPEALDGGHLGTFSRGELPESFETEVFALAPGKLSEIVGTDFGFHIFRVNAKQDPAPLALEDVADVIRVELLRLKSDEAMAKYLAKLRRTYPVKVFHENLNFAFFEQEEPASDVQGTME